MTPAFVEESEILHGTSDLKRALVANSNVRWGAIFAGLFVSLLTYFGLVFLGLAFGGGGLQENIQSWEGLKDLGMGASLWTIISALISICAGAYVSGRVAGPISVRVGRIQGLVIAAMFFSLMATQAGLVLGGLTGGLASAISTVTGGTMSAATSARGQLMIEDAIGDLNLKSPVSEVVKGVTSRLATENDRSVVSYLAHQTGLNEIDANAKYLAFKKKFEEMSRQAAAAAGLALKYLGITLFLSILFAALGAMIGGSLGAGYNLKAPISRMDARAMRTATNAVAILLLAMSFALMPSKAFTQEAGSSRIEHKTLTNEDKTDQLGVGLQVGNLSGVNLEYWLTNTRTINGAILGENQNVAASLSYAFMFKNLFAGEFSRFVPFVGGGVIGSSGSHSNVFRRDDNRNFALAAQVPVGIEYLPRLYRFGIFVEFAPSLQVTPSTYGFLTGDIGGRYYF